MNIVAHNLQGMFSERQLGIVNNKKGKSIEKLSSGYKVNRAADDAAGLAISEKMRRQIRGLTQGTENVQDGISMCQIADGAFSEVSDMLHRLTELSIQAANGTNDSNDRRNIQQEVDQLIKEIDRVSETTNFNDMPILEMKTLMEGTILTQEEALEELSSDSLPSVDHDITDSNGKVILSKNAANALMANMSCYFVTQKLYDEYNEGLLQYDGCNGVQTKKTADMMRRFVDAAVEMAKFIDVNIDEVVDRKYELCDLFQNATVAYNGYAQTSPYYIEEHAGKWAIEYSSEGISHNNIGFLQTLGTVEVNNGIHNTNSGRDFVMAFGQAGFIPVDATVYYQSPSDHSYQRTREKSSFEETFSQLMSAMKKIPSEDQEELNDTLSILTNSVSDKESMADLYRFLKSSGKITIIDKKDIWIQSGTDKGDGIMLEFQAVNSGILGISGLNVSTESGARNSIGRVEEGLQVLSSIRSEIGAQQNRLEHTLKHQENTIENIQKAESQIRDTDMAEEMMRLSAHNVIEQTAVAMLSQANQSNQGVLNLLK